MNKEIYTISFKTQDELQHAMQLLDRANLDFYHSQFYVNIKKESSLIKLESLIETQDICFKKYCQEYIKQTPYTKRLNGVSPNLARYKEIISESKIKNYLRRLKCFKHESLDKIEKTIDRMLSCGYIERISFQEAFEKYNTKTVIFRLKQSINKKGEELDSSPKTNFFDILNQELHSGPIE